MVSFLDTPVKGIKKSGKGKFQPEEQATLKFTI